MASKISERRRQALALRGMERAQKIILELEDAERINQIRAKAANYIPNNPQPPAVYLLG